MKERNILTEELGVEAGVILVMIFRSSIVLLDSRTEGLNLG